MLQFCEDRWKGTLREVARIWTLHKGSGEAVCKVLTHPAGWEVRLTIDDFVLGRDTFQREAAILSHAAEWRTRFIEHGWQA
jgi:hypothetical protein